MYDDEGRVEMVRVPNIGLFDSCCTLVVLEGSFRSHLLCWNNLLLLHV